jgi:hypothetical protein
MAPPPLVIGNLDIERVAVIPSKADPVLVVDANTVLSCAISLQRLQSIRRGRSQVAKFFSAIDLD